MKKLQEDVGERDRCVGVLPSQPVGVVVVSVDAQLERGRVEVEAQAV